MDFGLFNPRSNAGVAGGPPGLDSWCVVASDPSGVLVKPAGTRAYHVDGGRAWDNLDGGTSWVPVSGGELHLLTDIIDDGGAVSGDLVRVVATGVLAKALASTVAGVASLIGAWDGSTVLPLIGFQVVNFDTVPILALPAYVSAVTAGLATHVPNLIGGNSIGIVVEDLSVGAAYKARVSCPTVSTAIAGTAREAFAATVCAITGADPRRLMTIYEQFLNAASMSAIGLSASAVVDGRGAYLPLVAGGALAFLQDPVFANAPNMVQGSGWRFGYGARVKCASVDTDLNLYLLGSAGQFCLRITEALGARLYYGAGNPQGGVYPATFFQVAPPGAVTLTAHNRFCVFGLGTSTYYVSINDVLCGPFVTAFSNAITYIVCLGLGAGMTVSDFYYSGDHRG